MTGPPSNRLLSSLAAADLDAIRPHLETIDLPQETVLFEDGDTISRVYFPHRGIYLLAGGFVANTLQQGGLIAYKRGHIRLQDVEGLKESACECYETLRSHADRLLGPAAAIR